MLMVVQSEQSGVQLYHADPLLIQLCTASHKSENVKISPGNEGALPPTTPISPYLVENATKILAFFLPECIFFSQFDTTSLSYILSAGTFRTHI